MPKLFTRTIEDFVCSHCGATVQGNGYTDHCPFCLWSRHVDVNPGDREEKCRGEMEPQRAEFKSGNYTIYYRCLNCGYEHRVKADKGDNEEELLKLISFN